MAVKMVISRVFEEFPGMERLEGYVNVETKASQRVLEKAGFQKEGVLQKYIIVHGKTIDVIMYSFLKTDQIINWRDLSILILISLLSFWLQLSLAYPFLFVNELKIDKLRKLWIVNELHMLCAFYMVHCMALTTEYYGRE